MSLSVIIPACNEGGYIDACLAALVASEGPQVADVIVAANGCTDDTVARARTLPEEMLHASVDGEWSFIETLRHLGFASAAWIERMVLGEPSPWHPFDLPWDEAPGWDGIPWDRSLRPSLDEVLAVRRRRQDVVSEVMATLDDERLAATVTRTEPGWPSAEGLPVSECLSIVLIEEWEHRGFAERDLGALGAPGAPGA